MSVYDFSTTLDESPTRVFQRSESSKCDDAQRCQTSNALSGHYIAVAVAVPVVLVILGLGSVLIYTYRRNKKEEALEHDPDFDENGEATALPDLPNKFHYDNPFENGSSVRYPYAQTGNNSTTQVSKFNSKITARGEQYVDSIVLPYSHETDSKHSLDLYSRNIAGGEFPAYTVASRRNSLTSSLINPKKDNVRELTEEKLFGNFANASQHSLALKNKSQTKLNQEIESVEDEKSDIEDDTLSDIEVHVMKGTGNEPQSFINPVNTSPRKSILGPQRYSIIPNNFSDFPSPNMDYGDVPSTANLAFTGHQQESYDKFDVHGTRNSLQANDNSNHRLSYQNQQIQDHRLSYQNPGQDNVNRMSFQNPSQDNVNRMSFQNPSQDNLNRMSFQNPSQDNINRMSFQNSSQDNVNRMSFQTPSQENVNRMSYQESSDRASYTQNNRLSTLSFQNEDNFQFTKAPSIPEPVQQMNQSLTSHYQPQQHQQVALEPPVQQQYQQLAPQNEQSQHYQQYPQSHTSVPQPYQQASYPNNSLEVPGMNRHSQLVSPEFSTFSNGNVPGEDGEDDKVLTSEEQEELRRMKSLYKVYFDRGNSLHQKNRGANIDGEDGAPALPDMNDKLTSANTDYNKRLTTASSFYEEFAGVNDNGNQYVPQPEYGNQQYNGQYDQYGDQQQYDPNQYQYSNQPVYQQYPQQLDMPANVPPLKPLEPLKHLPSASDLRKSTIDTFTNFAPRHRPPAAVAAPKGTAFNPLDSNAQVWSSPTNAQVSQFPNSSLNGNNGKSMPSASQLARSSVVMVNPVEIGKPRKFKPAGSIATVPKSNNPLSPTNYNNGYGGSPNNYNGYAGSPTNNHNGYTGT